MKIGVVGYGYMGETQYLPLLMGLLGMPQENLILHDRDAGRRAKCTQKYPGVTVTERLEGLLLHRPDGVFVLVNSPEHLSVLRELRSGGVRRLFVEKPLVLPDQLSDMGDLLADTTTVVGYQINWSGALQKLFELMTLKGLVAREVRVFWGKDRIGDSRPTGGDLEDEGTHGVRAGLTILRFGRSSIRAELSATLTLTPYMDRDVQQAAHERDASYPKAPNATTDLSLRCMTHDGNAHLFVQTSFISFDQVRRIDVSLDGRSGPLTHKARLEFDAGKADRLHFGPVGAKSAFETWEFLADAKLRAQTEAVLETFRAGSYVGDPRLTTLEKALEIVRITKEAIDSDRTRETRCVIE